MNPDSDRRAAEPAAGAVTGFSGTSLSLGRALVLLIGFALAGTLFAISAWMNYRFGRTLGVEETDRALYGAASLAADGFKALSPFLLIGLWRARRWLLAGLGAALWALCVAWSLASALGFAAATREASTAARAEAIGAQTALRERAARLESQMALLPAHRPAAAVAAEIEAAGVPRDVWRRTDQCRDVTRPDSLAACQNVLTLRRELAAAEQAARLEAALAETRAALAAAPRLGDSADPQAEALSGLLGESPGAVRGGLALVITGLIELGASLGFTLVAIGAGALKRAPPRARPRLGEGADDRPVATPRASSPGAPSGLASRKALPPPPKALPAPAANPTAGAARAREDGREEEREEGREEDREKDREKDREDGREDSRKERPTASIGSLHDEDAYFNQLPEEELAEREKARRRRND